MDIVYINLLLLIVLLIKKTENERKRDRGWHNVNALSEKGHKSTVISVSNKEMDTKRTSLWFEWHLSSNGWIYFPGLLRVQFYWVDKIGITEEMLLAHQEVERPRQQRTNKLSKTNNFRSKRNSWTRRSY